MAARRGMRRENPVPCVNPKGPPPSWEAHHHQGFIGEASGGTPFASMGRHFSWSDQRIGWGRGIEPVRLYLPVCSTACSSRFSASLFCVPASRPKEEKKGSRGLLGRQQRDVQWKRTGGPLQPDTRQTAPSNAAIRALDGMRQSCQSCGNLSIPKRMAFYWSSGPFPAANPFLSPLAPKARFEGETKYLAVDVFCCRCVFSLVSQCLPPKKGPSLAPGLTLVRAHVKPAGSSRRVKSRSDATTGNSSRDLSTNVSPSLP